MSKCHKILVARTTFFSGAGEIENVQELKLSFQSNCLIADDSQVKIVWLKVVVFSEHDIFYFWDNAYWFRGDVQTHFVTKNVNLKF